MSNNNNNNFTTPVRERPLTRIDDNKPLPLRSFPAKSSGAETEGVPAPSAAERPVVYKDRVPEKKHKKTKPSSLCLTPPSLIKDAEGLHYHRGLCIGEGGFARCFQVRNGNDEIFAAKTIAKVALVNVKTKDKLITEIDIHRQLDHPNLVKFIDCFEDFENVYMLLEMCSNRSLVDLIYRRRKVTEPEARFWFVQMLGAVGYMHSRGVVHRDLKLGNIFLDKDLNVKVGDFGLAAEIDKDRRRYTVCGTPNYISPEVLNKPHAHGKSVDIWALGIILYSMLVGRPPFQDREVERIYERIRNHQTGFPLPPSQQYQSAWEGVSAEARAFITRMLNPDPMQRPTFSECLKDPWITKGLNLARIPECAVHTTPTFDHIDEFESKANLEKLIRSTQLDIMCSPQVSQFRPVRVRGSKGAQYDRQKDIDAAVAKGRPAAAAQSAAAARVLPHHISPPTTKDKYKQVAVSDEAKAQIQQRNVPVYDSPVVGRKIPTRDTNHTDANNSPWSLRPRSEAREQYQYQHQHQELFPVSAMRTSTVATTAATSAAPRYLHPGDVGAHKRPFHRPAEMVHRKTLLTLPSTLYLMADTLRDGLSRFSGLPDIDLKAQSYVSPPLVVTRWADFEESWGISYSLSDGSTAMLYRDHSSLRCDPILRTYAYYETHTKPGALTIHPHDPETIDVKRQKKTKILNYVREYMDRELAHAFEFRRGGGDVSCGEVLHRIQKLDDGIMFVQSDGTTQFNFRDHSKVIVYDHGNKVAFITEARQLHTGTLESVIRGTRNSFYARYHFTAKLASIERHIRECAQRLSK